MNNPWKLIALLAGIFLLGGISGGFFALRFCRPTPALAPLPPTPDKWAALHLKRISEKITTLQPAQLEQIRPIVTKRMDELSALRQRYLDDNRALRQQMEREVAEKLDAQQRVIYEEHNRQFHERARMLERGERPPPRK